LSRNQQRRIKVIYDLHEDELGQFRGYVNAVADVQGTMTSTNLLPLTYRLSAWGGQNRFQDPDFPRFGTSSPDFHPGLAGFCSLDAASVYENQVSSLIERIMDDEDVEDDPSVPRDMARGYVALYRGAIQQLESQLSYLQNSDPPAPPAAIAALEGRLAALRSELEPKIAELQSFAEQF
jgi:hypothetical protein